MSGKLKTDFSVLSNSSVFIQVRKSQGSFLCAVTVRLSEMVDDCRVRYKWAESEHMQ